MPVVPAQRLLPRCGRSRYVEAPVFEFWVTRDVSDSHRHWQNVVSRIRLPRLCPPPRGPVVEEECENDCIQVQPGGFLIGYVL